MLSEGSTTDLLKDGAIITDVFDREALGSAKIGDYFEINGKKVSDMSLQQINEIFMSEENKFIKIRLLRNSLPLNKELILKDPIPYQED